MQACEGEHPAQINNNIRAACSQARAGSDMGNLHGWRAVSRLKAETGRQRGKVRDLRSLPTKKRRKKDARKNQRSGNNQDAGCRRIIRIHLQPNQIHVAGLRVLENPEG
nr:MAG TPA: hypothetical protein [Caudoviricetes sp.]